MKKLLSLLLVLVFLCQAMPADAIAAGLKTMPTSAELAAAVALTGLSDEAPGYRAGMKPSASMNAMQLAGWIHEFQREKQACIMDIFENYDVELAYVKEHYPSTFSLLQGFSAVGIGQLYDEYSNARAWRDEVQHYENRLTQTAARIDVLANYLQSGEITEREQVIYACEMRDLWKTLQSLIPEIVTRTSAWEQEYARLDHLLTGEYDYPGTTETLSWLLDEVDNLREMDGRSRASTFDVSASALLVAPDQTVQTRLARLSPISNAMADSSQKMTVKILDDKSFGLTLVDGSTRVSNASVSVRQEGKKGCSDNSDQNGSLMFPVREFQCDSDGESLVEISVNAEGYRKLIAPGVWVKKGEAMNIPMYKDDGLPYLVSWSFWGHDLQISKYKVVTSPINDSKQPIVVTVSGRDPYHLKVYFTNKKGEEPVLVGEGDGSGEKTFTFEGQWLMKAPPEGMLFAEITGAKTVKYQAKLELKKSVLQKPLGDPKINKIMSPGFQFTLPKGWVRPFGGLTIEINLPVTEKWQVRGYLDLNGSVALTVGTRLLEDLLKDANNNWKTKDQKALDKAVKEAKDKGYLATAKAKNGGDWAGRSKWSPMKLGAISFDLCFFAFIQGQYSEDGYGYGQVYAKGGAGFTGSVKGSYTLMWPVAQLSAFVSATLTVFPEVAVMMETYWPSGQQFPDFKKFEYAKAALNIIFRIDVGVEACLGLKGIVSVSIRGAGYVEFAVRAGNKVDLDTMIQDFKEGKLDLEKYVSKEKELTIYAGGSVNVTLEILWAKAIYALLNPPLKYKIYPPDKNSAAVRQPVTMVERFLASFISTAKADEEEEGPQEGGGQVDTSNADLMIEGTVVRSWNAGTGKTQVVNMRRLGSSTPIPVVLYIAKDFRASGKTYNRPILVGTPVNRSETTPLLCQNGMTGDLQDHFLPADGYDVIDFDCWVADATPYGVYTYTGSGVFATRQKLNDVLFTVCILAKDYHDEEETLSDGTVRTVRVPNETWAYVSCYCLDEDEFIHVLLPAEQDTNNYLSMAYPLKDSSSNHPSAQPRICGMIRTRYNDPDSLLYQYVVVTNPVGVVNMNRKFGYTVGDVVLANHDRETRVKRAKNYNNPESMSYYDSYMRGKQYVDYHHFPKDDDLFTHFYLAGASGSDSGLYDLVFGCNEASPVGFPSVHTMSGIHIADRVVSMAARDVMEGKPRLFYVQQSEDGESYRLMGCRITDIYYRYGQFYWELRDYDIDMPRTDLQWTKLYGRECVYWTESAGETEDGSGNLFKVRAVWYDEEADAVSEPFVIATVKTPTTDGVPADIRLAGDNEGYYFVQRDDGSRKLYRFNFQMVPGLRLVGNVLTETLANPGSYDDMLLTVFNNGNIPLTGFDIRALHEVDGKSAEVFETIHIDLINPSRNSVTLRKGLSGGTEQRYGEDVIRTEASSLAVEAEEYRYVNCKTYYNGKLMEEAEGLMKPVMLMPNTFRGFNISLLIPQSWEGSHHVYLEVDRFYMTTDTTFQSNVLKTAGKPVSGGVKGTTLSVGRDGSVRVEGGVLSGSSQGEAEEYASMYKTDITFDRIELETGVNDLNILATQWDNNGEPMVTLTVTNWAHIGSDSRSANTVVMEAFLDDETTPVFRYNLLDEVSDKETWNFDVPLSLLTGGRSASKVTVKIKGRDYKEAGDVDNSVEILLDTEDLTFLTQPKSQTVPAGSGVSFRASATGGRKPYKYQWQKKAPGGAWVVMEGENNELLALSAVTADMDGTQYRLVITDASGYSITSSPATLTVKRVPLTGDTAPLLWYAAGLLAATAVIVFILRKKKQQDAA